MYIALAVNNPKKYPEKPLLLSKEERETRIMSDEEMMQVARRNTIILGGKIQKENVST